MYFTLKNDGLFCLTSIIVVLRSFVRIHVTSKQMSLLWLG